MQCLILSHIQAMILEMRYSSIFPWFQLQQDQGSTVKYASGKIPLLLYQSLTWYQWLGATERLEQRQEDKKMWSPEPAAPGREAGTAHPWSCGTLQCLTHLEGNTAFRCVGSPSCAQVTHCSLGCGCSWVFHRPFPRHWECLAQSTHKTHLGGADSRLLDNIFT